MPDLSMVAWLDTTRNADAESETYIWTSWEKKVQFEEKRVMEKNGFEVPGGGGVSGD